MTPAGGPGAAVEITGVRQHAAWAEHVLPPVEHVGPGIWSVPVRIPDNPLRYVLVYVLELSGGVAIIDAGWPTDDAWEDLRAGLAHVGGGVDDVEAVLITHIHPDHYGLAGRVREVSGAWVGLHPADASLLDSRYRDPDQLVARMRSLLRDSGVPEDELGTLAEASLQVRQWLRIADPDRHLADAERLDLPGWDLETVWTPGHSPGHVCFYERTRRLLFSGDHVLPRITPNISAHPQQAGSPLAEFLDSLRKIRDLDASEVLPAHEYRFRGLGSRVDAIIAHHRDRLEEIARLLRGQSGATTWELTRELTWSRPWAEIPAFMRRAANGETLAHLFVLEADGRVVRDGHGPIRWRAVAGDAEPRPRRREVM